MWLPEAGVTSVDTSNLMPTLPTLQDLHSLPWTMDLRIQHERFGSRSNPLLNATLHFCAAWILISRSMMLLLIRFATTVLMVVNITLSLPCLPVPAPLAAFTVSLCEHFVFAFTPIGKRRHFLQLLDSIAARNVQLCT
jgi:hypothetical protein